MNRETSISRDTRPVATTGESMKMDFVQIGFQKCGTTFLEHNVYAQNPEIQCVHPRHHPELSRLFVQGLILPDSLEYERVEFQRKLDALASLVFRPNAARVNGLLFEEFTFLYERRFDRGSVIARLHECLPEVKIITFIRSQDTWLLSHYSQYLKSGGLLGLRDFVECVLTNPLLEGHHIDWFPLVERLYEVFGRDRVLVCLYEKMKSSPQDVADDIFRFLGVPSVEISSDVVNPSLSKWTLMLRRGLNHLIRFDFGHSAYGFWRDLNGANPTVGMRLRKKFIDEYYKPATTRLAYGIDGMLPWKGRLRLEARQRESVRKRYCRNNEKLGKLMEVDLSSYGYPV